jgi:hypothetical protein
VVKKLFDVRFISTDDQLANGFTKVMPQGSILEIQCNLNIIKLCLREDIEIGN